MKASSMVASSSILQHSHTHFKQGAEGRDINASTPTLTKASYARKHLAIRPGLSIEGVYRITRTITSPATMVIFVCNKLTGKQLCLKLWLPCHNALYDTQDITKRSRYTVEGLYFNRRFAADICLGLAPITMVDDYVRLGQLLIYPQKSHLQPGVEYALVMEHLNEEWRLDHHLHPGQLGTQDSVKFLAHEIATMHEAIRLDKSPTPQGIGNAAAISKKWSFNKEQFYQCPEELSSLKGGKRVEDPALQDTMLYEQIGSIMDQACLDYAEPFEQRYNENRIRRCHGDLKATNLWVRPAKSSSNKGDHKLELLALDCVDFKPEFCYIDTLSDVAMLAVNIEMYLSRYDIEDADPWLAQELTQSFLDTYLSLLQENTDEVKPLLEYYMTEKAVVCTYMSILYDGEPALGLQYLKVALHHAQKLKGLTPSPAQERELVAHYSR
jgi:aminoglycoside phosphotransferase family enzyme